MNPFEEKQLLEAFTVLAGYRFTKAKTWKEKEIVAEIIHLPKSKKLKLIHKLTMQLKDIYEIN